MNLPDEYVLYCNTFSFLFQISEISNNQLFCCLNKFRIPVVLCIRDYRFVKMYERYLNIIITLVLLLNILM